MHGYLCVHYNFRVMHLFVELDVDWIGYGSKSCLLSWIGLGEQIIGLDFKNGPMRNSARTHFWLVRDNPLPDQAHEKVGYIPSDKIPPVETAPC